MRVAGRATLAAVAALLVGLIASFFVAGALRSATPAADLLWRAAPTGKVAMWVLTGAHGSQLTVEAGAEITNDRLADIGSRVGDILENVPGAPNLPDPGERQGGEAKVALASFTILAACGAALALLLRNSGLESGDDALVASGVAAGVYAIGLAAVAALSSASVGVDIKILRAGVEASVSPFPALGMGIFWGAVFALIGSFSAPAVVQQLSPDVRAVGAGLRRAGFVAAIAAVLCLIVLALTRSGGGGLGGLSGGLAFVGVVVLGLNIVAAAIVLAHGATMTATFTAGPLDEWARLGYSPAGAGDVPVTRWLFLAVPILAGFAAGRVMARRTANAVNAAIGFALAWGFLVAAIAVMLRVRILSSFSIDAIEAGGGAEINPLAALVFGAVWGGVLSYIGFLSAGTNAPAPVVPVAVPPAVAAPPVAAPPVVAPVAQPPVAPPAPAVEQPRYCPSCGAQVPPTDRFCGSCGKPLP